MFLVLMHFVLLLHYMYAGDHNAPAKINNTMTNHPLWSDDYWPLVMQLFLRRPVGVKPVYARATVDLALRLHIPPEFIYEQMFCLRLRNTPLAERLWQRYSDRRQLRRDIAMLQRMEGLGSGGAFYEGVTVSETWETDFRPIAGMDGLQPVALVMILDLYFRLTPITMVAATPEVRATARLLHIDIDLVLLVLACFRHADPYLAYAAPEAPTALIDACMSVWRRYGNDDPIRLSAFAAQLHDYFK